MGIGARIGLSLSTASAHARRRARQAPGPAIDVLEPRLPMSADLGGAFLTVLPTDAVGGTSGKVQIDITNGGDAPAVGPTSVDLFLSTDNQIAPDDQPFRTVLIPRLNLQPGQSKRTMLKFRYPADLPNGDYFLLARLDPQDTIPEDDLLPNDVSGDSAVSVVEPFVDLTGSFSLEPTGTLAPGQKGRLKFTVVNHGNVPFRGKPVIRFVASPNDQLDGSDVDLLAGKTTKLSLRPGAIRTLTKTFKVPAALWNADFKILVALDSTQAFAESDESNNTVASTGTFSVVGSSTPSPVALSSLEVDPGRIMVGFAEQFVFHATVHAPPDGAVVQLYQADAQGNPGEFLLNLVDNGDPLSDDEAPGDGVFSNTFSVQPDQPGDLNYVAVLTSTGDRAAASVTVVDPPTDQRLDQIAAQDSALQDLYQQHLDNGQSRAQSLAAVRLELLSDATIDPGSIVVADDGIAWRTVEGITGMILADEADVETRSDSAGAQDQPAGATPPPTNAPANPRKKALVLSPYAWQFEPADEGDDIAAILATNGYDVTLGRNAAQADQNVGVENFKNLGDYGLVAVATHGGNFAGYGVVISTGQVATTASNATYRADLVAGRLVLDSHRKYMVTPSFVSRYDRSMKDTVVLMSACKSIQNHTMSGAFLVNGAGAYIGFTDTVESEFAYNHALRTVNYLLGEGHMVGDIPGIDVDTETDSTPARFEYDGSASAQLQDVSTDLSRFDLYIQFKWPQTQHDLDTATVFLGVSAGYACDNSSPYLSWSGDDTSAGGTETVIVGLGESHRDGGWTTTVDVDLNAGWYQPAGGSGPALLTVALYDPDSGEYRDVVQESIAPGTQVGRAATSVGTVTVVVTGDPGAEEVSFILI